MKIGSGINGIILALGGVCALFCLVLSWQLWDKGQETGTLLDQSLAPALALGQAREATGQAIFWAREYSMVGDEYLLDKALLHALPLDSLKTSTSARDDWLNALDSTANAMRTHKELAALLGDLSDQFRVKVRLFLAAETRWQTYENTMPGVTAVTRQNRYDRITTVSQVILLVNEILAKPINADSPRIPSLLRPMETLATLPRIVDKGKLAEVRAALGDLEYLGRQWPQSSSNLQAANEDLASTSNIWMAEAEDMVDEYLTHVQEAGLDWKNKSRIAAIWMLAGCGLVMLFSAAAIVSTKRIFGKPLNSVTKDLELDLQKIEPVGLRLAQAANSIGLEGESLNSELKEISLAMGELTEALLHQDAAANSSATAFSDIANLVKDSWSESAAGQDPATQTKEILRRIDEVVAKAVPETKAMVASAGSSHQKSVQLQNNVDFTWNTAFRTLGAARSAAAGTGPLLTHLGELKQISEKLDRLEFKSPSGFDSHED